MKPLQQEKNMSVPIIRPASTSHVDAYLCTGSSPGLRTSSDPHPHPRTTHTIPARTGSIEGLCSYEVHGPAHAPAVVVLGGISANRHLAPTLFDSAPGWWPGVVGSGRALDPAVHRLVGVDWLTDDGRGGTPTTEHQARAVLDVLDREGIERGRVVGASYGGMVALALASVAPARVQSVVAVCAAHRTHPLATAWRALQRRTVRFASAVGHADEGLKLARGLAMTTYRTAIEFEERFGVDPVSAEGPARFEVEDYLDARGEAFARTFGARAFLALSESIDLHRVDPARVQAPATFVSFEGDVLVPPWLVAECAEAVAGASRHVCVPTRFGHDAFLKETHALDGILRSAFCGEVGR